MSEVQHHPTYGPALPLSNWVPAPRYLLRRSRVLKLLRDQTPCRVVDIGCGSAALLSELAQNGFDAYGVDRSPQALEIAKVLVDDGAKMHLSAELEEDWLQKFDLVLSFEVVEHLEDDIGAMTDWARYLTSGGRMILSTPAHPHRWNASDVWAGHVRRYTRQQLIEHVEAAGFTVEHIECYGFPLANVVETLRAKPKEREMRNKIKQGKNTHALTDESGSDRSIETKFWKLFASWPFVAIMRIAMAAQIPFLSTDLGNGYLLIARKN